MLRLFFGVPIPSSARDALDRIAEGVPHARWVPEDNYHVTLSYLGEVPARKLEEVEAAARAVRTQPFTLSLESVGVFPRRPPARVLWAGVRAEPLLLRLQRRIERELAELGFLPEARKFHPHVTLARLAPDASREAVSDWLAHHLSFRVAEFPVTRFHLYASVRTPGGSQYEVCSVYPLRAVGSP